MTALLAGSDRASGRARLTGARPALRTALVATGLLLMGLGDAVPREGHALSDMVVVPEVEALSAAIWAGAHDAASAEAAAQEIVALLEAQHGPDALEVAAALDLLGGTLRWGKKYDDSVSALRRAEAIKREVLGAVHPAVARSIELQGHTHFAAGRWDEAREAHSEAVRVVSEALGPEDPRLFQPLRSLGIFHVRLAEWHSASEVFARIVSILDGAPEVHARELVISLHNLAMAQDSIGRLREARSAYERALGILEGDLEPDGVILAQVLDGYAATLLHAGDLAGARTQATRRLALVERQSGTGGLEAAIALNNLGLVERDLGDHASAHQRFTKALAIREELLDPDHHLIAQSLNNLAVNRSRAGDPTGALPLFERAVAIYERSVETRTDLATTLLRYGQSMTRTGELAAARRLLERAERLSRDILGDDHYDVALCQEGIGETLELSGDLAVAEERYLAALSIHEQASGGTHPLTGGIIQALARLKARAGDRSSAADLAGRAFSIFLENVLLTVRALPERQALGYATRLWTSTDILLSIALSGDDPELQHEAYEAVIRSRAIVLDEVAARRRVTPEESPEVSGLRADLAAASRELAQVTVRGPAADSPADYRDRLRAARDGRERAEVALAERSAEFRRERESRGVGIDAVRAAMPERTAVVSYVRFDRYDSMKAEDGGGYPPPGRPAPSYAAFVLDPEGLSLVDLGDAAELEHLVSAWRGEATSSGSSGGALARLALRRYRTAGKALRAAVWDPLLPRLAGAERVLIVPDGALHLISFAALPVDDERYLVEESTRFHYLTAERDLVRNEPRSGAGQGLLVVGDPDFDRAASGPAPTEVAVFRGGPIDCRDFGSVVFPRLPGSATEARDIIDLWQRTSSDSAATALLGEGADEAVLKNGAPGSRNLHLATHGFFLTADCAAERLPDLAMSADELSRRTGSALVLSGLVLAGANRRGASTPDSEDGILTGREIAALDLGGVDWAVLSACDTGAGELRAGEGVLGLRRAFQVAGAATVIMSLWPADDLLARRFMTYLYEARLIDGESTIESVRRASLSTLEWLRSNELSTHPFRWGGWIAAGDHR